MKSKQAFTLVELLIVIIITTVLATIAIPKFANSALRAKEARLKSYLRMLREATNRYKADTTLWPQSGDLLNGTTPTQGIDDSRALKNIPAGSYFGPYIDLRGMQLEIPGVGLAYSGTGASAYPVGTWRLTGAGTALDGTMYATW